MSSQIHTHLTVTIPLTFSASTVKDDELNDRFALVEIRAAYSDTMVSNDCISLHVNNIVHVCYSSKETPLRVCICMVEYT